MKVTVKFIKPQTLMVEWERREFKRDDQAEVEQQTALERFRDGIVLPGYEFGALIPFKIE
jgi:hypothetical protein